MPKGLLAWFGLAKRGVALGAIRWASWSSIRRQLAATAYGLPKPRTEAGRIRATVAIAAKAEEVCLDVFATDEHHSPPFTPSSPTTLLGYVAARTRQLILSTSTVYGHGPSLEEFTSQTPLTVGTPEQVIERTLGFRDYVGDYQRQLFLIDHAGLPLKTVLEQLDHPRNRPTYNLFKVGV